MGPKTVELHDESRCREIDSFLADRIYGFNVKATGYIGGTIQDDTGETIAGITGHTWGGCCEIIHVWVHERHHRQGFGTSSTMKRDDHASSTIFESVCAEMSRYGGGRSKWPADLPDLIVIRPIPRFKNNATIWPVMKSKLGNRRAVELKPASITSLLTLKRLIKSYYAFDHIPFRDKEIKVGRHAFLRDPSLGRAWLIMHGKATAGYVIVIFWFDLEFGGRAALITDLYLTSAHRRKGFGRRALRHIERFCQKAGINSLELQVEGRNTAAQQFYAVNGFRSHSRIPMSKRLPPL